MISKSTFGKFALALVLSGGLISAAHAYTAEQEQFCTGDAMRLCSSEIPDVDRVTACMMKQKSQLSPACKSVFNAPPAADVRATPIKVTKPMNLVPAKSRRNGI
jgi:hypothetical protein